MKLDEFRACIDFIELGGSDEEIVIKIGDKEIDIIDVDRLGDGPLCIIPKPSAHSGLDK